MFKQLYETALSQKRLLSLHLHGVYTRRSLRRSVARPTAATIAPCKQTRDRRGDRSRDPSRRSVARPIAATIASCKHAINKQQLSYVCEYYLLYIINDRAHNDWYSAWNAVWWMLAFS